MKKFVVPFNPPVLKAGNTENSSAVKSYIKSATGTVSMILLLWHSPLTFIFAQDSASVRWLNRHPIEISVGSHNVGLPFHSFLRPPYYLQLNAGLQFNLIKRGRFQLNQYIGLGAGLHPYNGNRFFMDTNLRLRYNSFFKTYVQFGIIAAGVAHDYPQDVFIFNNTGSYEKARGLQIKGELFGGLSLELGHPLRLLKTGVYDFYVKYSAGVAGPHHPSISLFPYHSFQLGCRIYFSNGWGKLYRQHS